MVRNPSTSTSTTTTTTTTKKSRNTAPSTVNPAQPTSSASTDHPLPKRFVPGTTYVNVVARKIAQLRTRLRNAERLTQLQNEGFVKFQDLLNTMIRTRTDFSATQIIATKTSIIDHAK